jgi:LytTr DNA-binding domain-containing protein
VEPEAASSRSTDSVEDAERDVASGTCPLCATPLPTDRFRDTLRRARTLIDVGATGAVERTLLTLVERMRVETAPQIEYLVAKKDGHGYFVKVESIDWIEASRNRMRLHVGQDVHVLRSSMGSIEAKLDPRLFRRIHRSTIVNIERVKEMHSRRNGHYTLTLMDGTELTMSEACRQRWREFRDVAV